MLVSFSLQSRAAVFVLMFAAVMFFTFSRVSGASPVNNQQHGSREDRNSRQSTQCTPPPRPRAGILPTNTEPQITACKSLTSGSKRKRQSFIDPPPNTVRFTQGDADGNPSPSGTEKTRTRTTGGTRLASSVVTQSSERGGQSFKKWQNKDGKKVYPKACLFDSHLMMIRKSSPKHFASRPHQRTGILTFLDREYPRKSLSDVKKPKDAFVKVAENISIEKSLLQSRPGGYLNNLPLMPQGRSSSSDGEKNELPAATVQSRSSSTQSKSFFGFTNHTASHAPSIPGSVLVSVIKKDPSPEKLTPSITHFSHVSSSPIAGHKEVQPSLFMDTQTSLNTVLTDGQEVLNGLKNDATVQPEQRPFSEHGRHRFSSNFLQFNRKSSTWRDDRSLMNSKDVVRQDGDQTRSFSKPQHIPHLTVRIKPQSQLPVRSSSVRIKTVERVVPAHRAHSKSNNATNDISNLTDQVNATTERSMNDNSPEQNQKWSFKLRGSKSPLWRDVKPSVTFPREKTNLQRHHFAKFKTAGLYSSLSPRYSFGWGSASPAATTTASPKRTHVNYTSPSPVMQMSAETSPGPFTSGFKAVQRLLPQNDTNVETNPKDGRLKIYKKIYSLRRFDSQLLNRSQTSRQKSDRYSTFQKGLKVRVPLVWHTGSFRIHKWYNQTVEAKSENRHETTSSQSQREEPLLKTTGSNEFPTTVAADRKNHKFSLYEFKTLKNKTANGDLKPQNSTEEPAAKASPPYKVSSVYLGKTQDLEMKQSLASEPRTPNRSRLPEKKVILLRNTVGSSSVRGRRVKVTQANKFTGLSAINATGHVGIVRRPRPSARIKPVTYSDIVGSASFTGVRAANQKPKTDGEPWNTAPRNQQKEIPVQRASNSTSETSRNVSAQNVTEVHDLLEENNSGEHKEGEGQVRTSRLFFDREGSGDRDVNLPATGGLSLGNYLAELEYLQRSTWNTSFKSVGLSGED